MLQRFVVRRPRVTGAAVTLLAAALHAVWWSCSVTVGALGLVFVVALGAPAWLIAYFITFEVGRGRSSWVGAAGLLVGAGVSAATAGPVSGLLGVSGWAVLLCWPPLAGVLAYVWVGHGGAEPRYAPDQDPGYVRSPSSGRRI